jgi:hypothetical protein
VHQAAFDLLGHWHSSCISGLALLDLTEMRRK